MLLSLALIIIFGFSFSTIVEKIKLPGFVGLILAGIVLGPHAMNLISEDIMEISSDLKEMALIIVLIRAGLSLNLKELKKVGRPALLMCFIPSIFEMAVVIILAPLLLKITYIEAGILAAILSAVSLAVVVPEMIKLMEKGYGKNKRIPQMIMAGAAIDNVFIVVIFSAFMGIWNGESIGIMTFLNIPISIIIGVLLGYLGGTVLKKVQKILHVRDTIKILMILAAAFIIIEMEERLKGIIPISGLLGVVFIGVYFLKHNEGVGKRISIKLSKVWVFAEILLFVLVGASVNLKMIGSLGIAAVLIILLETGARIIGVFAALFKSKLNTDEKTFCGVSYIPKATVQAAIGAVPLARGVEAGELILAMAVLIIFITAPLGAIGIDLLHKKLLIKGE